MLDTQAHTHAAAAAWSSAAGRALQAQQARLLNAQGKLKVEDWVVAAQEDQGGNFGGLGGVHQWQGQVMRYS